jgi:hypothetical protein
MWWRKMMILFSIGTIIGITGLLVWLCWYLWDSYSMAKKDYPLSRVGEIPEVVYKPIVKWVFEAVDKDDVKKRLFVQEMASHFVLGFMSEYGNTENPYHRAYILERAKQLPTELIDWFYDATV